MRGHPNAHLVRVVSPEDRGVVVGGKVRVVVHAARGVRLVRVRANAADVTKRFRRTRGGYAAVLRRGRRGLRFGTDLIQIVSRRGRQSDFDTSMFVLAREHGRLLSGPTPRRLTGAGQVTLRYRLASRSAKVRMWVNGRRRSLRWASGRHALALDGDDGLHAGINQVVVDAFTARGLHDVERRTVRVLRSVPMPAAGKDRHVRSGHAVRLDARRSRALRGGRLSYRWRIVRAPRGSHPRLLHSWSARPVLRQHKFGTYRLRLTVSEHAMWRGPGRGAVAAQIASANDTVSVLSAPAPPIGVAIDTLASYQPTPGTTAGFVRLGLPSGPVSIKTPDPGKDALQVVVLNRQTLELESNQGFTGDDAGTWALLQYVKDLNQDPSGSPLVIITTPSLGAVAPAAGIYALGNLNAAINKIGGEPIPQSDASPGGSFSVIGIPGMVDDQGDPACCSSPENLGLRLSGGSSSTSTLAGDLRGYLQQDDNYHTFSFVSPDYVPFKTDAPTGSGPCPAPCQAKITVGSQSYVSRPISSPQGGAGFYVLVLDAGDLSEVADGTFGQDATGMAAMHDLLAKYTPAMQNSTHSPYLVFVQSIGPATLQPGQAAQGWDQVAKDTSVIGGNPYLLRDLAGSRADGFALAGIGRPSGVTGIVPTTAVASEGLLGAWESPGSPIIHGTLQGELQRDYHSRFYPGSASPGSTCSPQCQPTQQLANIAQVAYQPATAWPYRQNIARHPYADVLACIVQWLNRAPGVAPLSLPAPIQQNYLNINYDASWPAWSAIVAGTDAADLKSLANPSCTAIANKNPADIGTVARQLSEEFAAVGAVRTFITNAQQPFQTLTATGPQDISSVSQNIQSSLDQSTPKPAPPNLNAQAGINGWQVAADALDLAAPIPFVGDVTGEIATLIRLVSDSTTNDSGTPEMPKQPWPNINGPAAQLGVQLQDSYQATNDNLGHVGDLFVSDWGKLKSAAQNLSTGGPWELTTGYSNAVVNTMTTAAYRQAWETLFPLAYTEYNLMDLSNYQMCAEWSVSEGNCAQQTNGNPKNYICAAMLDWQYDYPKWQGKTNGLQVQWYLPLVNIAPAGWFTANATAGPQTIAFALQNDGNWWWSQRWYNYYNQQTTPSQSVIADMFINDTAPLNPLQLAVAGFGLSDAPNGTWGGSIANTVTHLQLQSTDAQNVRVLPPQFGPFSTPCVLNGQYRDGMGDYISPPSQGPDPSPYQYPPYTIPKPPMPGG